MAAWQMPQGGIDPGERPADAAWRELEEEVGTRRASLRAESGWWYAYDLPGDLLPAHWDRRFAGQTQRWFLFDFEGVDQDFRLDHHQPEFTRWRWASPGEILGLIVDFKRPVYEAVFAEFELLRLPER